MTNPPPPPFDVCNACPSICHRGSQASMGNCRAYRMCIAFQEKYGPPPTYSVTRGDLVDRAIGWGCFGFVAGFLTRMFING